MNNKEFYLIATAADGKEEIIASRAMRLLHRFVMYQEVRRMHLLFLSIRNDWLESLRAPSFQYVYESI